MNIELIPNKKRAFIWFLLAIPAVVIADQIAPQTFYPFLAAAACLILGCRNLKKYRRVPFKGGGVKEDSDG